MACEGEGEGREWGKEGMSGKRRGKGRGTGEGRGKAHLHLPLCPEPFMRLCSCAPVRLCPCAPNPTTRPRQPNATSVRCYGGGGIAVGGGGVETNCGKLRENCGKLRKIAENCKQPSVTLKVQQFWTGGSDFFQS